jgi:hypothetical protein
MLSDEKMKISKAFLIIAFIISSLLLSACKPSTPQPALAATATITPTISVKLPTLSVSTPTLPPPPTETATADPELCDNTYFNSNDETTWTYSGNNSKLGDYTRTDTIVDSRDDGFTLGTSLPDVSYSVEFACAEAGLIDMDPLKGNFTALFSGPSGAVNGTTTGISGLTFPRDIQPGDTWQHVVDWEATYTGGASQGQFIYQYLARGLEVVTVPWGTFDAMHLDVQIEIDAGAFQSLSGTYEENLWLVKDIGIVKSEGTSHIPGVEFSDTLELTDFSSPP